MNEQIGSPVDVANVSPHPIELTQTADILVDGQVLPNPARLAKRRSLISIWITIAMMIAVGVGYGILSLWHRSTVNSLAVRCRDLSDKKDWTGLEPVAKHWSRIDPFSAEPWLFWAEAAEANKDWKVVAACLGQVPRHDSRIVPSLARKIAIEFENLNRPWEGLKTCDELLTIEPRVLLAHKQAIFFCAMTLQRAEMVRRIRRAIRVRRESPDSYVYLASASWFYGASLYRHNTHWLEADPDCETFQVARAMQIYMSEAKTNLEEASKYEHIPTALELLQKYPHNPELLTYLIDIAIEDGDVDRVQELFAAAPPQLAAGDARFWRVRGWLADASGDLITSSEAYLRAYSIDPYWWKIHYHLQDIFRRLGQIEQAEQFLRVYEISVHLYNKIIVMNQARESFEKADFREPMLKLAELVGDGEVAIALHERLSKK